MLEIRQQTYTVTQAAKIIGVSRETIHRWLNIKTMLYVDIPGGLRRIPESEIEKFIKASEYAKIQRMAKLWDDLKHVLQNGKWTDNETIKEVLITMSNMEFEISANKPPQSTYPFG